MKPQIFAAALFGLIAFSWTTAVSAQNNQASRPNGASSLSEVYQDWRVGCSVQQQVMVCVLSQDQVQQSGQRILAMEVQRRPDGSAAASLLLPFGILLEPGVTLQIDEQAPMAGLKFRTCLPSGCQVVFSIDTPMLTAMRQGSVLKLNVTTAAETPLIFPVSLNGLSSALDRVSALGAP